MPLAPILPRREEARRKGASVLGFPLWIRLTHLFNFLFLTLLLRSGIEILGGHPKLYWSDDALPGSEWLRLTRKALPSGEPWTAEDEIQPCSPWLAMPGRNNLGLGRHWHFWSALGWVAVGLVYVALLVATPQWRRLVPTSLHVFADAWRALTTYLRLELPPEGNPYNPLQQLTYFVVVFVLAPLQIVTGLMMSPALGARFPWFARLLGGRQAARSLHFLGLVAFSLFLFVHAALVVAHGFGAEMANIVLGSEAASRPLAVALGLAGIALVAALHAAGTLYSLRRPARTKRLLEIGVDPLRRALFHHWAPRQRRDRISAVARTNGRPPRNEAYRRLAEGGFAAWRLEIKGLVAKPGRLSLEDLRAMPPRTQSTLHVCIQGWSYFAEWTGVAVSDLLDRHEPLDSARYLVFHTLDEKWESPGHGHYYEVIDLETARMPQVILAYEMNGQPLPIPHGAPLRLRVEHQLGYKMAKWVCAIELVEDFRRIGKGQGGWRDDVLNYYPSDAGI
ncbi:oxidoreductase [Sorangium cellulosum]|uniref:Oxidoreductase n=1 Tax=Sorangium cellulosum TaxID=56 RepID=A0A4P2R628_SORCE|nr:oxidoreductase [Sorangium cellulosum]